MNHLVPIRFCSTFVKWLGSVSFLFKLTSGVRQGGVLSSYLFAVYIDDLIIDIERQYGCCTFHFVSSFCGRLTTACKLVWRELATTWIRYQYQEVSLYTRSGPRFNGPCTNIVTSDSSALQWVDSIRYLYRCFHYSIAYLQVFFTSCKAKIVPHIQCDLW